MNRKSVLRRVVLAVPTVMLVIIGTAFTWDFASTSVKSVAGVFTDARGNGLPTRTAPYYRGANTYNKSLNVAHLVSYSVAASLLVASTGFATRMMRDEK
jgi:hypothetical protein